MLVSPRSEVGKHAIREPMKSLLSFGAKQAESRMPDACAADPSNESSIRVKITDIDPYHQNLRIRRNQKYQEIRASILKRGLEQKFAITREPGANRHTVARGGNTRLQILKELYEETGDERFLWQELPLQPWQGKRAALLGHLVENELRDDFTFFERARAVSLIKAEITEQTGQSPSLTELAELLAEEGFALDRSTLSRMLYTVDELAAVIPETLRAGIGQPQVREIRKTVKAAQQVLLHGGAVDDERNHGLIMAALERSDRPAWQKEDFVTALVELLVGETGYQAHEVRLALRGAHNDDALAELLTCDKNDHLVETQPAARAGRIVARREGQAKTTNRSRPAMSLGDLRAAHFAQAQELARSVELESLLLASPQTGFGYLVKDVPELEHLERLQHVDAKAALRVKAAWFHLLNLSGALSALQDADIARCVTDALPEDSMLRAAIKLQSMDPLSEVTGALLSPSLWSFNLLGALTDMEWQVVKQLEGTFRQLLAIFDDQRSPWGLTKEQ